MEEVENLPPILNGILECLTVCVRGGSEIAVHALWFSGALKHNSCHLCDPVITLLSRERVVFPWESFSVLHFSFK